MVQIYGGISTETPTQANRLFDVTEIMFLEKPDEAPLTALLTFLRNSQTIDPKFSWFKKGIRTQQTLIDKAAGYVAGDTIIQVDDATLFVPKDVIIIVDKTTGAYGEQIFIEGVNITTNELTVRRGVGIAAAVIANNDIVLRVGNAHEEGSDLPAPLSQKSDEVFNFTQIFRHAARYSRTAAHAVFRAGNQNGEIFKKREEKTREHKREMEANFIWGNRFIENAGTETVRRFTGGLNFFINESITAGQDQTQAVAGGGALTEAFFEDFLGDKAFTFGAKEKWALSSPKAITVMNSLHKDKIRLSNMETQFGLNILRYESAHGIVNIVRHELFTQGIYKNAMLFFDPDHLELRWVPSFAGGMTSFREDIGEQRFDRTEDDWTTEAGLQVAVPGSLALLTNIVSAA